jgi:curved DNA-binding protein CbpA
VIQPGKSASLFFGGAVYGIPLNAMPDETAATPDFYAILGITRDASTAAVKAAFRRKAKTQHPDRGGNPEAFRLLRLAYEVLSDPERRRHYDDGADPVLTDEDREQLMDLAGDLLVRAFAQSGAPEFDDVIKRMRADAAQQIAGLGQQIQILREVARKMALSAGRIEAAGRQNLLRDLVQEKGHDLHERIEELQQARQRHERVLLFLEEYRYVISDFADDII